MSNPLIKPGGWPADVATITAAEGQQLDEAQAASLDGATGGNYEPTADINVTDGAGGAFGNIDVHGQLHFKGDGDPRSTYKVSDDITATNNQLIGISGGQIRKFADTSGVPALSHDMVNTGATKGDWIKLIKPNYGGVSNLTIYKSGSGFTGAANVIVVLLPGTHATAKLYFDGTDWKLGPYAGASAGQAA